MAGCTSSVSGCEHGWARRLRRGRLVCSWWSVQSLLIILLCVLLPAEIVSPLSLGTGCSGEEGAQCCQQRMQQCWLLYEAAQEQLGVPDLVDSQQHQSPPSGAQQATLCIALRTYYVCLKNISCTIGDLSYHAAASIAEKKLSNFNCNRTGPVHRPRGGGQGSRSPGPQACPYTGPRAYHYCTLFGDPHLRTYDGSWQTCRISGAWPLIENEHFTIQVTSEPIGSSHLITAVAQVTVMLKKNEQCGSVDFVTYEAQRTAHLPLTFDDGRAHFGPQRSISIHRSQCGSSGNGERRTGECVELYMRHIDTTIVIRRLAGYLSVAVHIPRSVANSSSAGSSSPFSQGGSGLNGGDHQVGGIQQLCMAGCPRSERFSLDDFVHHKHGRLKMRMADAADICAQSGATDGFFDACVEDLVLTGNQELALTAAMSQADMVRLYSGAWRTLHNRTSLLPPSTTTTVTTTLPSRLRDSAAVSSAASGRMYSVTLDCGRVTWYLTLLAVYFYLWICFPNR